MSQQLSLASTDRTVLRTVAAAGSTINGVRLRRETDLDAPIEVAERLCERGLLDRVAGPSRQYLLTGEAARLADT